MYGEYFCGLVLVYHGTWFVNSATHAFGYKNFQLGNDLSTNCWWVAILAYGEGWHNNHHAFPKSAQHGLRPMELDLTWLAIWTLKKMGLAKNIQSCKSEIAHPSKTPLSTQPLKGKWLSKLLNLKPSIPELPVRLFNHFLDSAESPIYITPY